MLSSPLPSDELERTHNSIWKTHLRNNPNSDVAEKQTLKDQSERFSLIPAAGLLATLPPKMDWVIQDFLPSKIVAAVIAAGGTGKSYLAMHIAVCVASSTPLFGRHRPRSAAKVVFISGEDDRHELQRRLHKVVAGLSPQERLLVNQNLHFIDLADSFELFTERNNKGEIDITKIPGLICDQVTNQIGSDIGLIIVDPVARFRGGEENLAADATRFVQALQQIRDQLSTSVLCLHHVNKGAGTGGNQNNARGSSAFIDGVRLVFQLNTLLEPEIRKSYGNPLALPQLLTLQSVKSNYGKPAEPMVLARRDDGSLELFDVIAEDHQQNDLIKEIEVCKLSKTQFKALYGGVKKKFGLAEKALLEKLEQLNREGLITIPNRGVMTVTESGKKLTNS
jgi:RecA-family ATPase